MYPLLCVDKSTWLHNEVGKVAYFTCALPLVNFYGSRYTFSFRYSPSQNQFMSDWKLKIMFFFRAEDVSMQQHRHYRSLTMQWKRLMKLYSQVFCKHLRMIQTSSLVSWTRYVFIGFSPIFGTIVFHTSNCKTTSQVWLH